MKRLTSLLFVLFALQVVFIGVGNAKLVTLENDKYNLYINEVSGITMPIPKYYNLWNFNIDPRTKNMSIDDKSIEAYEYSNVSTIYIYNGESLADFPKNLNGADKVTLDKFSNKMLKFLSSIGRENIYSSIEALSGMTCLCAISNSGGSTGIDFCFIYNGKLFMVTLQKTTKYKDNTISDFANSVKNIRFPGI